ncbi:Cyclin-dependent kinase 1 [Symbiodinium microadriaticum]|uniref:Cyclin-dependent kinase 1 n=1 Tax=Symbiodinium microadriaticum TaxID=2951 RepID=A0A1Q9EGF7_SYMMI|nr:Cyclin-dependent kinase 1 [Symbiodinium microadriaticum]CAE7280085.1 CPK27 [Symbiodinium sp. KB8]CAE7823041.1 CPK27 [Symbiodinium microadriaticum]
MPETLKLELPLGDAIGEGTSGVVSPVLHSADGGRYAAKRLKCTSPKEALDLEVRLLRLCSAECSDIVRYAFACETATDYVLIFEACDVDLWDALTGAWSRGKASSMERRAWSMQLCRAVSHCHRLRVLHRDVNPWNVLLVLEGSDSSSARLGDFGLAVRMDSLELRGWETPGAAPLDDSAIGSLYSSPELGDVYGFPADVFSLGMTLLAIWASADLGEEELITLVEGAKQAACSASSSSHVGSLGKGLPWGLCSVLADALAHQAAARPSAASLRDRVEVASRTTLQQVKALFKTHCHQQLTPVVLGTVLDSLGSPKESNEEMVALAFRMLGSSGRMDVDSFLKWVFQEGSSVPA